MSFCQPVSGEMPSVINPSNHLSISSLSRVKPACDMPHLTVMLRRCGVASLISEPTGCIHLGEISANVVNTLHPSLKRKKNPSYIFFRLMMEKNFEKPGITYSQANTL